MIEQAYQFRRKLQVIALALGGIAALICYAKAHAHVDLVHVEVDTIVREMIQDMHDRMEKDKDFCGGRDQSPEADNEPGVKHD